MTTLRHTPGLQMKFECARMGNSSSIFIAQFLPQCNDAYNQRCFRFREGSI